MEKESREEKKREEKAARATTVTDDSWPNLSYRCV